ncbi:IMP cyclohydrolase [Candidatus Woesearchaeota archaeon]|nr:IMP cyclohydrolase [Candidatus Woesearchaeota archaeon]
MAAKKDYRKDYSEIMDDSFPDSLKVVIGGQELVYRKRLWAVYDEEKKANVKKGLRYGENPGQEAAMYELINGNLVLGECEYVKPGRQLVSGISEDDILQIGKHPSMNNLTDVDSALNILRHFHEKPTAIIIKHNNPSGVASREKLSDAYNEANLADAVAAFGGVAVFNRPIDTETASEIGRNYLEVVCAPDFDASALGELKKKKNLRIIRIGNIRNLQKHAYSRHLDIKPLIDGGIILQQSPLMKIRSKADLAIASSVHEGKEYSVKRQPTDEEYRDLLFAWKVQQGVTSNSVIFAKGEATIAIGTGEQDRVGVAKIAAFKAYEKYAARLSIEKYNIPYWLLQDEKKKKETDAAVDKEKGNLKGAVMSSDGFFPFRDTVDVAAKYGVTAIIQPGGSIRDWESIEACNQHNIAMVFTGQRAFRH